MSDDVVERSAREELLARAQAAEARLRGVPLRAVLAWRPPRPPAAPTPTFAGCLPTICRKT